MSKRSSLTSTLQRTTSHTLYEASSLQFRCFGLTIIWPSPARDISGWHCRRPLLYQLVSASGRFVHSFERLPTGPTGSLQSESSTTEACGLDRASNSSQLGAASHPVEYHTSQGPGSQPSPGFAPPQHSLGLPTINQQYQDQSQYLGGN